MQTSIQSFVRDSTNCYEVVFQYYLVILKHSLLNCLKCNLGTTYIVIYSSCSNIQPHTSVFAVSNGRLRSNNIKKLNVHKEHLLI